MLTCVHFFGCAGSHGCWTFCPCGKQGLLSAGLGFSLRRLLWLGAQAPGLAGFRSGLELCSAGLAALTPELSHPEAWTSRLSLPFTP